MPGAPRVAVIGAGVGGLCAALDLAAAGCDVTVLEKSFAPGGKLRTAALEGNPIDAGPTVLTMRWVFDELLDRAGTSLDAHLRMQPLEILARHAWSAEERLDLHARTTDSAAAIARFSGAAQGRRFLAFAQHAESVYRLLEASYLRAPAGGVTSLIRAVGLRRFPDLWRMQPFRSLWNGLGAYFPDGRLRQLFGRYATYCGTSPFEAPSTLMLIASVEQSGVWAIDGGIHRLAALLADRIAGLGGRIRYGVDARSLEISDGAVRALHVVPDERLDVDAVVANLDPESIRNGALGAEAGAAIGGARGGARSFSAVTLALEAAVEGMALSHHNVFFSRDSRTEFQALALGQVPEDPTVYVCAQARTGARGETVASGSQPLFCLMNAPANGDRRAYTTAEIALCEDRIRKTLDRSGVRIGAPVSGIERMTPSRFEKRFPGTGGALYGSPTNGWRASFQRPGARTLLRGLYLAGASVHPGPGLPMVALSARQAAMSVLSDLRSISRWRAAATHGGTSTR